MKDRRESPALPASRLAAALIAVAFLLFGVFLSQGAAVAAALPLAAWAVAGLFAIPPRLELEAERRIEGFFPEAGSSVKIALKITNIGPRLAFLRVEDGIPPKAMLASGSPSWEGSLDHGGIAKLEYELILPRGSHNFEFASVMAEAPFSGIFSRGELPCPGRVDIKAKSLLPGAFSFASPLPRPFAGSSRSRARGGGCDFAGTREYAPGDRLRDINWRAEALWGQLVVNVFEEEKALDAGIILDSRAEAYFNQWHFEAAVAASIAVAKQLLEGGSRVAFLRYGSVIEWTPPGSGRFHRLDIELAGSRAKLGSHAAFERFDNLPVQLFPAGSLVLLVSPLLEADLASLRSIKALGYSLVVLRPDPLAVDGTRPKAATSSRSRELAERFIGLETETFLSRLLEAGIELVNWNPTEALSSARSSLYGYRRRRV